MAHIRHCFELFICVKSYSIFPASRCVWYQYNIILQMWKMRGLNWIKDTGIARAKTWTWESLTTLPYLALDCWFNLWTTWTMSSSRQSLFEENNRVLKVSSVCLSRNPCHSQWSRSLEVQHQRTKFSSEHSVLHFTFKGKCIS